MFKIGLFRMGCYPLTYACYAIGYRKATQRRSRHGPLPFTTQSKTPYEVVAAQGIYKVRKLLYVRGINQFLHVSRKSGV